MGLCVDIFCWPSETFSRRQVFDIEKLLSWIVVKIFGRFRYIFFCLDFSAVWMSECLLRHLLPVFSNNFIVFFFGLFIQICKIFWLCFKTRLNVLILYQWQDFRRKTIEFFDKICCCDVWEWHRFHGGFCWKIWKNFGFFDARKSDFNLEKVNFLKKNSFLLEPGLFNC